MNEFGGYPVEKELSTGGKPVELCWSVLTYFGTHDSNTSGDRFRGVLSNDGKVLLPASRAEEWQEISPGVEIKFALGYGSSSRTSSWRVRVQPSVCPVILLLEHVREYSASDYPHGGFSEVRTYSTRVVK